MVLHPPVRADGPDHVPEQRTARDSSTSISAKRRRPWASWPICRPDDWITSTHRGHGHALAKGVPPKVVLAELAGKGHRLLRRTRREHAPLRAGRRACLGPTASWPRQFPRRSGWPSAPRPAARDQVTVAFFGDGASNHGAFSRRREFCRRAKRSHRICLREQSLRHRNAAEMATRNTNIASKAAAYGIPGVQVDGNDVLAVWQAAGEAIRRAGRARGQRLSSRLPIATWDIRKAIRSSAGAARRRSGTPG